jgi:hypothetical protein
MSMYKTLTVAALLLAAFAFTSGSRSADASPTTPISAPIVAKGKVVSQTAEIPQTTIFTPGTTGLYRLSAYMVETAPGPTPNIYWNFNLFWTDDGGSEENPGNMLLAAVGGFGTPTWTPGSVSVFQAHAGQPVSYSVTLSGGTSGGTYSVYYTLERLE